MYSSTSKSDREERERQEQERKRGEKERKKEEKRRKQQEKEEVVEFQLVEDLRFNSVAAQKSAIFKIELNAEHIE